jgi:hypothetical protein
MSDSTDDGSPDRQKGPRGAIVLVITGLLIAALVGGGFAINRFVIGDDGETVDAVVPTTVDDTIDVEPVSASPTRVFVRETLGGIEIRVNESDSDMFGGGMPVIDDDARPGWCRATTTLMATALSANAIGQVQLPRTEEPSPDPAVMLSSGGLIEEAPLVLVLAQVGADVTQVRISHPSGKTDSMAPTEGLIAVAIEVPMPDQNPQGGDEPFRGPFGFDLEGVAVEFLNADGTSQRLTDQQLWNGGLPMWSDPECMIGFEGQAQFEPEIPVLQLPKPGREQPADPAAEQARVEHALEELYDNFDDDATLFRLIDDPSGIDLLMVGLLREHGDAYRAMDAEISDFVFFSPIEASFVYTTGLDPWNDGFSGKMPSFGRARLVDGAWKITRSTVCQDIVRIGMQCTI